VAQALVNCGAISAEEARHSPYQHVLHKFLGCVKMEEGAEVKPFAPQAGDRLVLGSDGLTNHVEVADLIEGPRKYPDPQEWADYLVETALGRGSRDNASCIVVVFDAAG
jgi:protein phosphatase